MTAKSATYLGNVGHNIWVESRRPPQYKIRMDPIEHIRTYRGGVAGFTQPSLFLFFRGGEPDRFRRMLNKFSTRLNGSLTLDARLILSNHDDTVSDNLPALFARLLTALEMTAGLPNFGRLVATTKSADGVKPVLCFESLHLNFSLACVKFIRANLKNTDEKKIQIKAKALFETAPAQFTLSTNLRHLIKAAYNLQIPVTFLNGNAFLLGWGRHSRIISSSSTERTSAFSVSLARDKVATRNWLMQCDIPMPNQRIVHNFGETIVAARDLGFPVVIKPRSSDGGAGVTTNILREADLEKAFNLAAAEGGGVLLERHINGREYRLLIVNGSLLSVHERVPARVIGNGVDTISHLIEQENDRRQRVRKNGFSNIPISIGDDSDACLAAQGLHLESIPVLGREVRLRMVPKVQTGGAIERIDPASVHPEVVAAAEKAARMMRLDIAGVDFIACDHSQSWYESGGVITEVNAIPQINRFEEFDIHGAFLRAAAPEARRAASLLMTDLGPPGLTQLQAILAAARARGIGVGLKLDGEDLQRQFAGQAHVITQQQKMLSILGDRQVDCIIVLQKPADILQNGLVLGHFDGVLLSAAQNGGLEGIIGRTLFRRNFGDRLIYHESMEGLDSLKQIYPIEGLQSYSGQDEMVKLALALLAPEDPASLGSSAAANHRGHWE
jgi:D-alanine-D-alanine ligase-like ATP-grasp enzyme